MLFPLASRVLTAAQAAEIAVERAKRRNLDIQSSETELAITAKTSVIEIVSRDPEDRAIDQRFVHLKVQNHRIVLPDARLEYELPNGGGSSHVDIEVATSAYHRNHIASKVQAGFKLYISGGDIGRLGAGVTDDHDLMSQILDI